MSECITDGVGNKYWYLNNKLHREDGPAVEYVSGNKYWYFNGKYHRENGPAIEYYNGTKHWYIDDKRIDCTSNEEFLKFIKMKAFW